MIFSSQNPSYFAGRQSVSQAMRNRMHMVYMDPYSNKALIDIAKEWHIAEPELFVEAFVHCKEANMRTFYTLLASPEIPKIKPPVHMETVISQSQNQEINKEPKLRLAKITDTISKKYNLDQRDKKTNSTQIDKNTGLTR